MTLFFFPLDAPILSGGRHTSHTLCFLSNTSSVMSIPDLAKQMPSFLIHSVFLDKHTLTKVLTTTTTIVCVRI